MVNNYYVYISEMKKRFLLSIFTWVCCIVVGIYYQNNIIFLLIKPCLFKYKQTPFYFIYNNIGEPFYTNIQIIFLQKQMLYCSTSIVILIQHFHSKLQKGQTGSLTFLLDISKKVIVDLLVLNIEKVV